LGVPCVADRALQRSAAQVLSAIYEPDFLTCSFGGRPGRGAHQALASLHEVISGGKVEWGLEADLKNFFGSLSHDGMLRFVEHRIGDPRLINLIRRWLKASVLEDGEVHANEEGTPQGGSISVMLSNVYLHYVLDLWFARVVKPRLRGEAYLVRYLDDFGLCFQYRADALGVQKALCQRLSKFGLALESSKTKLVAFGRFAQQHASKRGRKRPETIYFLGFTLYCTCNRKGNFRVGLRTEKSRLRRALMRLQDQMRRMRHLSIREQTDCLNQNAPRSLCVLRHRRQHTGVATGPSGRGTLLAQDAEQPELARARLVEAIPADQGAVSVAATKAVSPLLGAASYRHAVKQLLTSVVREICTLRSVGAGARATLPGHPVAASNGCPYRDRQLSRL
jgi:group II intron reverse transcriptase/maturase